MACGEPPSNYQPYSPRGRWIRTANDSYFVAMTYPEGMPAVLKPSDIHDALWGVLSAVYGGAVHPTAEGYAAMADAALPAARGVLGLTPPPSFQRRAAAAAGDAFARGFARRRRDATARAVIKKNVIRHPEVRAERASKDTARAPRPSPFEARASRGHLRVTGYTS